MKTHPYAFAVPAFLAITFGGQSICAWSGGAYSEQDRGRSLTSESGAAWERFSESAGEGWIARFDAVTGTVHRAYGPPIQLDAPSAPAIADIEDACRRFIHQNIDLFGTDDVNLELTSWRLAGEVWYIDFQQLQNGISVSGSRVLMRVTKDGKLIMFGAETFPDVRCDMTLRVNMQSALEAAMKSVSFDRTTDEVVRQTLVVLPGILEEDARYSLCWEIRLRTHNPPGNWFVCVNARDGAIVSKANHICDFAVYGRVSGEILPQFYNDTPVVMPFVNELVKVANGDSTATDKEGSYSIAVDTAGAYEVSSMLYGDYLEVINDDGSEASHTDTSDASEPTDWTWRSPDDGFPDEFNVYYHLNKIHDWIKGPPFNFSAMDYRMKATVRWGLDYGNAFYDGRDIYFGEGDPGPGRIRNLALFSDVIYHEYTHGIMDHIYTAGGGMEFESIMEGFADYVAATFNNDPLLGNGGLYYEQLYARNLYNDLKYPDDFGLDPYHDGQIVAGAVWDFRSYEGAALADSLWFYAILAEPLTFEDFFMDFLLADDNNGDLSDGTPHDCSIYQAFGRHGIGPGAGVTIEHAPRKDSENTKDPYPVYAKVYCGEPPPLVRLYYLAYPLRNYVWTIMKKTGNPNEYVGEICPQPFNSLVKYYIEAGCVKLPSGAPEWDVFSFTVGLDTIPPHISHQKVPNRAIEGWPPEVNALITDNLGIKPAPVLRYRRNGVSQSPIPMERIPGTDRYYALMGSKPLVGDIFEYRIVAHDSSYEANSASWPSSTTYHTLRVCQGFFDNMENGPDGWIHYSTPGYYDEWRLTKRRHFGAADSMSWGCGQDSGYYSDYNHSLLETPFIKVDSNSRLIFWHRMNADTFDSYRAFDGGIVEATRDSGNTWEQIFSVPGYEFVMLGTPADPIPRGTLCYSGTFDWRMADFSLSAFCGDIKIRFRFGSNEAESLEGWYIDDVEVINCPETDVNEAFDPGGKPLEFEMEGAYPNPASSQVTLRYAIPKRQPVRLCVFNISGQLVRTLANGVEEPGYKKASWDGNDDFGRRAASGVYFAVLRAGDSRRIQKIDLIR